MKSASFERRLLLLVLFFLVAFVLIIGRLFYWQVLASDQLVEFGQRQYRSKEEVKPIRGEILAADGFPLATNKRAYLLYSALPQLNQPAAEISEKLAPLLVSKEEIEATESSQKKFAQKLIDRKKAFLTDRLTSEDLEWVILADRVSREVKDQIEAQEIKGLGFEEKLVRDYPEASMAAQLLGFVGKNEAGQDTGYFGVEGYYDMEMKGRKGIVTQETDALNRPILIGSFVAQEKQDGQDLSLFLDRAVQFIVEKELGKAVNKYQAKSGSVVVLDPRSGGVLAMAAYPKFDPNKYYEYQKEVYKNPLITDAYEPGSTFKIVVMAAALDEGAVEPDTKCDICDGPLEIDKYTIETWNDQYYPDSTMTEVIEHSDNVGMVFVARRLGRRPFLSYLQKFGFGSKTGIDLEGEIASPLKAEAQWSHVDLATAAFGQGIAVTGIQMARAATVIANQGKLVKPQVVKHIISGEEKLKVEPKPARQIISPKTAATVKEMMVRAVDHGEVKWLKIPGYKIAGKTGTAQIPVAGHYDEEKTIASFIGFAPADQPRFVMLTRLKEPQSSPWGSETAAPLFFKIAKQLLLYYGVQPD